MVPRVQSQGHISTRHEITCPVGWEHYALTGLVLWDDLGWDPGC